MALYSNIEGYNKSLRANQNGSLVTKVLELCAANCGIDDLNNRMCFIGSVPFSSAIFFNREWDSK